MFNCFDEFNTNTIYYMKCWSSHRRQTYIAMAAVFGYFTELALRLIQSIARDFCLCLCYRPGSGTALAGDFWSKSVSLKYQN